MNYIVFDLEFNQGYDFKKNKTLNKIPACRFEIIQIGALKLNENFEIIDELNLYIKPTLYKEIHPYVEKITALSKEFLKDKPVFEEVFPKFNKFIGEEDFVMCVWGNNDLRALYRNLDYYKMLNSDLIFKYIDVQKMATEHLKFSKGSLIGLKTAIEKLDIPIKNELHNALNDAMYTASILVKIKPKLLPLKIFDSNKIPKKV